MLNRPPVSASLKNCPASRCPQSNWFRCAWFACCWGLSICLVTAWTVASEPVPPVITPEHVTPHLAYLASPEREGRDDWGKVEAREYIIALFKESGLHPLFDGSYLQAVPEFGHAGDAPPVVGQNIGGYVRGTDPELRDEWIIVNAHYDHLGIRRGRIYPGADDNASGLAMLIEVARQVSRNPTRRSIAFVSFDLEEKLLWGSRWFVAHPPMPLEQMKCCLTADMIGRSLGGLDFPVVFALGAEHSEQVKAALDAVAPTPPLEVARLGIEIVGIRSDYGPFYYKRIPFLFFSTGEHPDYHTPRDTFERLDIPKVANVSTLMLGITQELGNLAQPITWNALPPPDLEEVQAVARVTQLLLNADEQGEFSLSNVQRFLISQVNSKTNYMLRIQKISPEERKWLVRATQVILYSTF